MLNLVGGGRAVGVMREEDGDAYFEDRSEFTGAFNLDISPMVADNLLCDRQPEAGSVFLAVTDERLEDRIAVGLRNSRAVVGDADFDLIPGADGRDIDLSRIERNGLTGVQHEIVEG